MGHIVRTSKVSGRRCPLLAGCLVGAAMTGLFVASSSAADLVCVLRPDTLSLSLGEPVRFVVTLENRSNRVLHVGTIRDVSHGDATYLCYRVEDPGGQKSVRSFEDMIVDAMGYDFEPLAPSAARTVLLYPNLTTRRISYFEERTERTFPRVGTYRIRVGYTVRRAWEELWHPPGDTLWSNAAVVYVREPTPQEQEIYEAIWSGRGEWSLARGDMTFGTFDENALERVIERYPENPAIRYALWARARALSPPARTWTHAQAVDALDEIRKRWPRFRPQEISYLRTDLLVRLKRFTEASAEVERGLGMWPWLRDSSRYMTVRIWAYARGETKATHYLQNELSRARKEGRPFRLADYPDMGAE